MHQTLRFLTAGFLLLAACTPAEKPATPAAPAAETAAPAPKKSQFPVNCFEQRLPDGSVLSFQYTEYYDVIIGILDYSYADKDGAHGTFKGTLDSNLIMATWNYTIEGSEQAEEILVKIDGDKALLASGELEEGKDGVLRLKDPAKVNWQETFGRVRCE